MKLRLVLALVALSAAAADLHPLFDGASLAGWSVQPPAQGDGIWRVVDGALYAEGRAGVLISDESFSDFELVFEWKLLEMGNSGLFYRVPDATGNSGVAVEYQLADNRRPASQQYPDRLNGSAYGMYPPSESADRPIGEWNQSRIIARGSRVEHWLNNRKIVEYDTSSADWRKRLSQSKFAKNPEFGQARAGRIAIQSHGDPVWIRRIEVRSLASDR